jgi:hypothetical protein
VARIVDRQRGEVHVDAGPADTGAAFTVVLPSVGG